MSSEPDAPDESLSEIYQKIDTVLAPDTQKSFKPWHKPRKHYLRIYQWCKQFRSLIKELGYRDGDEASYFGLPGADFLDVRTLDGVCGRAKISVNYLGFDSTTDLVSDYELNLSKHEVFSLGYVSKFSVLAKDRVEKIADPASPARALFEKRAPFDVVNLDLCDSVIDAGGFGSYFAMIKSICDLQLSGGRTRPWLLFLATRIIRSQVERESTGKLIECIQNNANANVAFAEAIKKLGLSESTLQAEAVCKSALDDSGFVSMLALGFAKWLLCLSTSEHPKMGVKLLDSFMYRVDGSHPDMLSLAFRMEPVIPARRDASGLAPSTLEPPAVDELSLALDLVASVSRLVDLDDFMRSNEKVRSKMVDKCGSLLATARYDKAGYEKWVENVER